MSKLAEQIVKYEKIVGDSIKEGSGYGWVAIDQKGTFTSWVDLLQDRRDVEYSSDLRELVAKIWKCADLLNGYLANIKPTCFLDDLTVKNVLIKHGILQGLVDFDVVCYGDPLFFIALAEVGIVCDIGIDEKYLYYISELCKFWGLSNIQRKALALYSSMHGLHFLKRIITDFETRKRLVAKIESWLKLIEI